MWSIFFVLHAETQKASVSTAWLSNSATLICQLELAIVPRVSTLCLPDITTHDQAFPLRYFYLLLAIKYCRWEYPGNEPKFESHHPKADFAEFRNQKLFSLQNLFYLRLSIGSKLSTGFHKDLTTATIWLATIHLGKARGIMQTAEVVQAEGTYMRFLTHY